ncbi:unnamed protein product [Microthlaspi erraticum]|uniref:Uncharacterized protein n=1 Tax=Microthlaspi erraticum TaxID=1685480 RepID=A0A6D2HNR8_9BRAS|nr:unnamed protein product [Microthlaspi erraticum]
MTCLLSLQSTPDLSPCFGLTHTVSETTSRKVAKSILLSLSSFITNRDVTTHPTHYAQRPRCAPGSSPPDGVSQGHFNLTPHSRLGLALIPNYNAPTAPPGESPTPSLWARMPILACGPHPCPTAGPLFLRGSNDLFTIPAINTRPFPVFWPHSHGFGNHFPKVTHPSTTPAQARLTLELLIDL